MDYSYSYEVVGDPAAAAGLWGFILAWGAFAFIFGIAIYVYLSLALYKIAKKTNTPNPWLAWIPGFNLLIIAILAARMNKWYLLLLVGLFIPVLNFIVSIAIFVIMIMAWLKIVKSLGKPDWWGIMIAIIPGVNLVFLGMLAWGK